MASFPATLVALLVASCAATAAATTFNVGDEYGWDFGFDYSVWTLGKTFAVGDKLVFKYNTSKAHTVTEVNESDFVACSHGHGPLLSHDDSGVATVTLTTIGVHYFICSIRHYCTPLGIGMKLAVNATVAGGLRPGRTIPAGDTGGSLVPSGDAGGSLVPASSAVAATAAGALMKLVLF